MEQLLVPLGEELARLRVRFAPGQMRACFLGSLAPPGVGQVGMERQEVEELRVREQVLGLLLTFVGVVRHTIKADGHWSRPGGVVGRGGARCQHWRRWVEFFGATSCLLLRTFSFPSIHCGMEGGQMGLTPECMCRQSCWCWATLAIGQAMVTAATCV